MNTTSITRVCRISLVACMALVLGSSIANAGHYGQSYSHHHHSSYQGHGYGYQGHGYSQRSYSRPQYGGYQRPSHYCPPQHRSQSHYGYRGGYQGGY
jgi:hypothetical protein